MRPSVLHVKLPWKDVSRRKAILQSYRILFSGHQFCKTSNCTLRWASQVVLVVKNPPANAGDVRDMGSIPGLGRSPGGGHGNPLEYANLENPMAEEPGGL